ncbi:MAG TPA: tetratricopeptide repeat protein, partial [Hyphomicrobiaceae bacterium]|nr:tetratricopeptide repeat protein [Hyphomicrobiaceae bacterium]
EGISRQPGQRQEWDKRVSANRAVLIDAFRRQIPLLQGMPDALSQDDLRLLQGVLKETGYYKGELTGRYGLDLRQAVLDLERAHGQLVTGRPSSRLIEVARLASTSAHDRKGALRELLKDGRVPAPVAKDAESDYALITAAATKAIELDSRFAFAYASRAAVHMAKGEHDRAVADYTQLIAIDGRLAAAYNSRGRAYHAAKDYERAIADFTKAIELDANNVDAYLGRSLVHFEKGDFDRAIGELDRAIAIDPGNAIAYNNRAWVHLKAGKAALGLADARRSLELRPQEAFSLDTLAHILEAMGRREEAVEAFRAALAVDPSLRESIEGLRRLGAEP